MSTNCPQAGRPVVAHVDLRAEHAEVMAWLGNIAATVDQLYAERSNPDSAISRAILAADVTADHWRVTLPAAE